MFIRIISIFILLASLLPMTAHATWNLQDTGAGYNASIRTDGTNWVIIDVSGKVITSNDGSTWVVQTGARSSVYDLATDGNGLWVAVGTTGTPGNYLAGRIQTSSDVGATWTWQTTNITNTLKGVAYDGVGNWVAVGLGGEIVTSTDGVSWTTQASGTLLDLEDVAFGNSTWMVVGDNGTVLTSTDNGQTWTAQTLGITSYLRIKNDVVAYDSVHDVWKIGATAGRVGGNSRDGHIYSSSDAGVNWTEDRLENISYNTVNVGFIDDLFFDGVAMWAGVPNVQGGASEVLINAGGNFWLSTATMRKVQSMAYNGNGTWVAIDGSGGIYSRVMSFAAPSDIVVAAADANGTASTNTSIQTFLSGAVATEVQQIWYPIQGSITTDAPSVFPVGTTTVTFSVIMDDVTVSSILYPLTTTATVTVEDQDAPVLTLIGNAVVTADVGSIYNDGGATALDNIDGDISANIVVDNPVDTTAAGSYTITYNVSDAAGNAATQLTRTVNVVVNDTTAPVITLLGNSNVIITRGLSYTDAGATASDNTDGNITSNLVIDNPVDTATAGNYTVTYDVIDNAGNAATQVTRAVEVTATDMTIPELSLIGLSTIRVVQGSQYNDAGALASDDIDGDISANIVVDNPVDTTTIATYTVTYNVADAAGNMANPITRSVVVYADSTPPIIYITGGINIDVYQNTTYVDAGATALDDADGDISSKIIVTNPVDTAVTGPYIVSYDVTDAVGNVASTKTRNVNVIADTTAPVISMIDYLPAPGVVGIPATTVTQGSVYVDPGATALDNVDGDITGSITVTNPVNTAIVALYTITYDVSDLAGNAAQASRNVDVTANDVTKPVITLIGSSTVTVTTGTTYNDAGVTASDDVDGDITANVVVTNPVDTAIPGTYFVDYSVTDSSMNNATLTRQVIVAADQIAPVITLQGSANVTVIIGSYYGDLGATAWDDLDGDITANMTVTNTVNVAVIGTYDVTYIVTDAAGNKAELIRTVQVVADTIAPVIQLSGSATVSLLQGRAYVDAGATALDNVDGDITGNITVANTVNTTTPGNYTVIYNVADAAGNSAIQVTRSVTVVADIDKPLIKLLGNASETISVGGIGTYIDAGATALDNVDGNITESIVVNNSVNESVVGTYNVTYNVSDAAGNAATTVTREVIVVSGPIPGPAPTPTPTPSGGGGGCLINTSSGFTPIALLFLIGSTVYLIRRRRQFGERMRKEG